MKLKMLAFKDSNSELIYLKTRINQCAEKSSRQPISLAIFVQLERQIDMAKLASRGGIAKLYDS
ncbi:MAG: hypothetical protein ABJG41_04090 [Cyclobacteriaceae bacterium]